MSSRFQITRRQALLLAGACAGSMATRGFAQEPTRVTAAYGATSLYNAPIWIAKDEGLFSKYGLDVELVQLTGARITAGLESGSAQFISSSASSPFLAIVAGGDALMVGSLLSKVPYDVVVNDDSIGSMEDLKGKIGAIALRGDLADVSLRVVLSLHNLDPENDVNLVQGFATPPDRLAALRSGSVSFTVLEADFRNVYEREGFRRLISVMEVEGTEFMLSGVFTTKTFARSNPEAVLAYLKAMTEALHVFATDKETTLKAVEKYTSRPAAEVEPAYDYFNSIMQRTPVFDRGLVEACLKTLSVARPEAADANPEDFYDASFVNQLESDGFFSEIGQN